MAACAPLLQYWQGCLLAHSHKPSPLHLQLALGSHQGALPLAANALHSQVPMLESPVIALQFAWTLHTF